MNRQQAGQVPTYKHIYEIYYTHDILLPNAIHGDVDYLMNK